VRLEGLLEGNLAGILVAIGDYEPTLRHAEASARIAHEIGNRSVEANAMIIQAGARLALGDPAAALVAADRGFELHLAVGDRYHCAIAGMRQADALESLGRIDEAFVRLADASSELETTGARGAWIEVQARMSAIDLGRGEVARALGRLGNVLSAPEDVATLWSEPHRIRWIAWAILDAAGDERAPAWLEAAHARLQQQADGLGDPEARTHLLAMRWNRTLAETWRARSART
jgi:hypothetical protein